MEPTQMTPRRPYLLRAFYDWLLDNQLTPHLVVDVSVPGISVPMEFARDGQIILNIAPHAVGNLELGNDEVRFSARFAGIPRQVQVPMAAVMAIYARENGSGTMFEPESDYLDRDGDFVESPDDEAADKHESSIHLVSSEEVEAAEPSDDNGDDEPPQPPRGRPALRVVK